MTYLVPIKNDVQTYFWVVFSYLDGLIPLRSFPEKGGGNAKPPSNIWIKADDEMSVKALNFADLANQRQSAFYVIPGIVTNPGEAGSSHIKQMQVLLIDIDDGDIEAKLAILESSLGEATLIVESGGITKTGQAKLHVYWQLTKGVRGDSLQKLLQLRYQIALSVGGDLHFKSAHQPIRVAGSVYHKNGAVKIARIRSYSRMEYELEELIGNAKKLSVNESLNANNNFFNFNTTISNYMSFNEIVTSKVYEGGNGQQTRFSNLSKIIGYWLRRLHEGLITETRALEEIHDYNLANVIPPWSKERLQQEVKALWKLHLQKYGEPKKVTISASNKTIDILQLNEFLADQSELPQDIIAPRILTPRGILVFGGAPKVGKSDFLLSLFVHLAAGVEFLGFKPLISLKIFYFQTEIEYHYLRERLQKMPLTKELLDKAQANLYITPGSKILLNEEGVNILAMNVTEALQGMPDIIAVDPIRNVFDGGRAGATENENDSMMFFLRERIEKLRDQVNPNAGIILVHHTKKITKTQFDEDPFQAFSGASSLRGYYTTGALLYKPELENNNRHLIFELRNGKEIPTKVINKVNGIWKELNNFEQRIANKTKGKLYDRERERRIKVIIKLLEADALKGKFYLMKQFAQKYQNHTDLGGRRAIYDDCSVAATQGVIKFFDNPEKYRIELTTIVNAAFGFMCTKNMHMKTTKTINSATGEITKSYINILPTHYKNECDGRKKIMKNTKIWDIDLQESSVKDLQF